jgi:lysophospholipase L1-like esterase
MPRGILDYYKCRDFFNWGDCQNPYDFSDEDGKPDVITVNIGTNDYALTGGNPPSNGDFQANYVNLVRFLQEQYPDAIIFCINPLQYTVAAPENGRNMWNDLHDNVKAAVDQIASDKVIHVSTGDPHSENAALHQGSDYSDNTHPTADGHVKFANFLDAAMTPVVRQNFPDLLPPAKQVESMIV